MTLVKLFNSLREIINKANLMTGVGIVVILGLINLYQLTVSFLKWLSYIIRKMDSFMA